MWKALHWLKQTKRPNSTRKPVRRARLGVEILERRDLPSSTANLLASMGNLYTAPSPASTTSAMTATMPSPSSSTPSASAPSSSGTTGPSTSGASPSSSSGSVYSSSGGTYFGSSLPTGLSASLNSLIDNAAANGQGTVGAGGSITYSNSWNNYQSGMNPNPTYVLGLPGSTYYANGDKGSYQITVQPYQNGFESAYGYYTETATQVVGGNGSGSASNFSGTSSYYIGATATITVIFQES